MDKFQIPGSEFREALSRYGYSFGSIQTPPGLLSGIHQKVARATTLMADLSQHIGAYELDCRSVGRIQDPNSPASLEHVERVSVVPIEVSITIGDIAHNLRCALDHLMHVLLKARGNRSACTSAKGKPYNDRNIQFPIFRSEQEFDRDGRKQWAGLSESDLKLIRYLQPFAYSHPDSHPLWLLHTINNIDKHRTVPVVTTIHEIRMHFSFNPMTPFVVPTGVEYGAVVSFPGPPGSSMQFNVCFCPTGKVVFGPGSESAENLSVLQTMESISEYVHLNILASHGLIRDL